MVKNIFIKIIYPIFTLIVIAVLCSNQFVWAQGDYSSLGTELLEFDKLSHQISDKSYIIKPIKLKSIVEVNALKPIKIGNDYDEIINLPKVLNYCMLNDLDIKFAKENVNYQKYALYSTIASAVPNNYLSYNLTYSKLLNLNSNALSNVFQVRQSYPVFEGGSIVYGIMAQLYRKNGWYYMYRANINDKLLDVYNKYSNLVLNQALLQIRANSLVNSIEQLNINLNQLKAGTGTKFACMQIQTQLANDKQAYLQQQLATRQAALALAYGINYPLSINLIPNEKSINLISHISQNMEIAKMIQTAVTHRPELKEFEQFRLAAKRNIQLAVAPLYPTVTFYTLYSIVNTTSTTSASSTSGAGVFGGLYKEYQMGLSMLWNPPGSGFQNIANALGAKALARQAMLQSNQELLTIYQQIRDSYNNFIAKKQQIDSNEFILETANEELRLANLRFKNGTGSNLEIIQARNNYNNAQINKLQGIIQANQAFVQLLHDTGVISVSTILNGYDFNS